MKTHLPEIRAVHRDAKLEQITIDLYLPPSLVHFSGHFPGLPLLPGVIQIDWAMRYACEYLNVSGKFSMMENIKFQAILLPDACVELTLIWDAAKKRIEFSYASGEQKYSSGRLVFSGGT
jgi:3-hydroxyacyl-[acyl-carrier-protein] dehydratase